MLTGTRGRFEQPMMDGGISIHTQDPGTSRAIAEEIPDRDYRHTSRSTGQKNHAVPACERPSSYPSPSNRPAFPLEGRGEEKTNFRFYGEWTCTDS